MARQLLTLRLGLALPGVRFTLMVGRSIRSVGVRQLTNRTVSLGLVLHPTVPRGKTWLKPRGLGRCALPAKAPHVLVCAARHHTDVGCNLPTLAQVGNPASVWVWTVCIVRNRVAQ